MTKNTISKVTTSKDIWDKVSIVVSALIPVSVAAVGGYYSWSMKQAEISASKDNLEIEIIKSRVEQAKLIHSFTEGLISNDQNKKKIAISAILLALPVQGKKLVESISKYDASEKIKAFAKEQVGIIVDDNVEYKLIKCVGILDKSRCYLHITSINEELEIVLSSTVLVDNVGNIFRSSKLKLADKEAVNNSISGVIVKGIPTLIEMEFEVNSKFSNYPIQALYFKVNKNMYMISNVVVAYSGQVDH